jgi:hypothetical protein
VSKSSDQQASILDALFPILKMEEAYFSETSANYTVKRTETNITIHSRRHASLEPHKGSVVSKSLNLNSQE